MRHRCTIERDVTATENPWGTKGDPDWRPHLVNQPCHAWFDSGTLVADGQKVAQVRNLKLIAPDGTDIKAGDRITSITDRQGHTELFTGPMDVEAVGNRKTHLLVMIGDTL